MLWLGLGPVARLVEVRVRVRVSVRVRVGAYGKARVGGYGVVTDGVYAVACVIRPGRGGR